MSDLTIKTGINKEAKPEAKSEEKPEVNPEVNPEVKSKAKSKAKSEETPEAKSKAKSEENPEAKPEVKSEVNPEVKPEVNPEEKPEAKSEEKPEVKSEVKSEEKPEEKSEESLIINIDEYDIGNFSKYFIYLYDIPKHKVNRELTFNEYITYYSDTNTTYIGSEYFYNLLNNILYSIMNTNQKGGKSSTLSNLKKHMFI